MKPAPDFGDLFDQWAGYARKLSGRYARRLECDRDDFFQELALAARHNFARFDPARGGFSTWLSRVARSVADRHVRADRTAKRRAAGRGPVRGGGELGRVADRREPNPADAAGEREQRARLRAALAALPESDRAVLTRHFELQGAAAHWLAMPDPERVAAALGRLRELLGG